MTPKTKICLRCDSRTLEMLDELKRDGTRTDVVIRAVQLLHAYEQEKALELAARILSRDGIQALRGKAFFDDEYEAIVRAANG